jgi:structural maintenance of chromosome 4
LKLELDEKTTELNENRGVEIEMRNKLEEAQKALAETQRKIRHWEDKLSKVVFQNIRYVMVTVWVYAARR